MTTDGFRIAIEHVGAAELSTVDGLCLLQLISYVPFGSLFRLELVVDAGLIRGIP